MTMPTPPPVAAEYGLWLLLDLTVKITETEKVITATTDMPFISMLFWNCVAPLPEPRMKLRRGVADWSDPHISWHPWGWVRQNEPGPVTVHTFTLTAGYHPSYIWFRIEGGQWAELTCPVCESLNIAEFGEWSFYCRNCGYLGYEFYWSCPVCHLHTGTQYTYRQLNRCLDCGHVDVVNNFKLKWHNLSYSPFFFEQWDWPPVFASIFFEPWTYYGVDPPSMSSVFWEKWSA